jgi:hypothetical protein
MANGAAIALRLVSEPECSAKPAAANKPDAGIEDLVGDVLVGLADVSVQAFREVQADGLSKPTRAQGGELISLLYQARQVLGEVKFDAMARRQAQQRLRQRHGVALSPAVVEEIADELIAIVVPVDATMRAMAH